MTTTDGLAKIGAAANFENAAEIAIESAATDAVCGSAKEPTSRQAIAEILLRDMKVLNADSDDDVEDGKSKHGSPDPCAKLWLFHILIAKEEDCSQHN